MEIAKLDCSTTERVIEGLASLLSSLSHKRVCVVGTTCTGKSTMVSRIPGARDQDKEVFPRLSKAESDYVCQVPWTEEIGKTMIRLVRERVPSAPGRPVFGTVVIDCETVVLLRISDALLRERCRQRGVDFVDAKNMQNQLQREIEASGIPSLTYDVG